MGKVKSYAFGLTIGSMIGGATVLLCTKKSGSQMRSNIKSKAIEVKEPLKQAKSTFYQIKQQVNSIKNEGLPVLKETAKDISSLVKAWQKNIQPNINQIKEDLSELENTKEKLESDIKEPSSV